MENGKKLRLQRLLITRTIYQILTEMTSGGNNRSNVRRTKLSCVSVYTIAWLRQIRD